MSAGFPAQLDEPSDENRAMLCQGILNPSFLELLVRIRQTNTLVIADRGFAFWAQIEWWPLAR